MGEDVEKIGEAPFHPSRHFWDEGLPRRNRPFQPDASAGKWGKLSPSLQRSAAEVLGLRFRASGEGEGQEPEDNAEEMQAVVAEEDNMRGCDVVFKFGDDYTGWTWWFRIILLLDYKKDE